MSGARRAKEAPESVPVRTGPFRYPAGSPGYLRHWELRLRSLPSIFSDRLAVRRKIAILRECHPAVPEAVAFCALVETGGDEFRSIALLSDADIAEELAGVASKIDTRVLMRLRPDISTDVRKQLDDVPETNIPGMAPRGESPEPRFLPRDAWAGAGSEREMKRKKASPEVNSGGDLPNPLAMPSFLWQRQLKREGDSFTRSQAGSPLRRAMMQMEEYGDAIETVKAGAELERGPSAASYPYKPDFAHGMPREHFGLSTRPSQKKRPKPKARRTPSADDDPRAMLSGLRQMGDGSVHDTITMSPHARSMRYVHPKGSTLGTCSFPCFGLLCFALLESLSLSLSLSLSTSSFPQPRKRRDAWSSQSQRLRWTPLLCERRIDLPLVVVSPAAVGRLRLCDNGRSSSKSRAGGEDRIQDTEGTIPPRPRGQRGGLE